MRHKKRTYRRGLALLLAIAMCISIPQLPAAAAEASGHEHNGEGWSCTYVEHEVLACENAEHSHTEECYGEEGQTLVCGNTEHTHDAECYDEEGVLACGTEEHIHGNGCYEQTEENLVCGLAEHSHTQECRQDAGRWECVQNTVPEEEESAGGEAEAPAVEDVTESEDATESVDSSILSDAEIQAEPSDGQEAEDEATAEEDGAVVYAAVDELNAAFEAVDEILESGDVQAGIDALDNYIAIYNRLSPEDQEAQAEALAAAVAYKETLQGSLEGEPDSDVETLVYVTYKSTITFYPGDGSPTGVNMSVGDHYQGNWYVKSISTSEVTFGSQYGEHNNSFIIPAPEKIWQGVSSNYNTVAAYSTAFNGEKHIGASALLIYTGGHATYKNVVNSGGNQGGGTTPSNPYANVVHEYYMNGQLTGSITGTFSLSAGATDRVPATNLGSSVPRQPNYNGNTYTYKSVSPSSISVAKGATGYQGTFTLRYERTETKYYGQLVYHSNDGRNLTSRDSILESNGNVYTVWVKDTNPFASTGKRLLGWDTNPNAATPAYKLTSRYSVPCNSTDRNNPTQTHLYAIWENDKVTLTYHANGGTNAPAAVTKDKGSSVEIASKGNMSRPGYIFLGWSIDKSATGADFVPGDGITLNADTTLYAVWTPVPVATERLTVKKVFQNLDEIPDDFSIIWTETHGETGDVVTKTLTKSNAAIDGNTLTWQVPHYFIAESGGIKHDVTVTEKCDVDGYTYTTAVNSTAWKVNGHTISRKISANVSKSTLTITNTYTKDTPPVVTAPKLTITKTADKSVVKVGESVVYTITVSNNGNAAATDVVVTDALPNGLSWDSDAANNGSYDSGSRTVQWKIDRIDVGGSATVTLTARVNTSGEISNTASAKSEETPDPVPCVPEVIKGVNMSIKTDKSHGDVDVTTKNGVAIVPYTVTVRNTGDDLYGLDIIDKLTDIKVQEGNNTLNAAESVKIAYTNVKVNGNAVNAALDAHNGGIVNAIARSDDFKANNTVTLTYDIEIENLTDKQIVVSLTNTAKGGSWASAPAVSTFRTARGADDYDVTDSASTSVSVGSATVVIPPKTEKLNVTVKFVDEDGSEVPDSGITLEVDKGQDYDVTKDTERIPAGYEANGNLTGDPVKGKADADKTIIVPVKKADTAPETTVLTAEKTADKTSVKPGEDIEYTITVKNEGDNAARGVKVTDVLDKNLTWKSAALSVNDGQAVAVTPADSVYTIGEIPAKQGEEPGKAVLTITATVNADTDTDTVKSISNTASVNYENKPNKPVDPENPDKPAEPIDDPESNPVVIPVVPGEEPENPEEPGEAPKVTWLDENGEIVKQIPMPEGGDYSAEYPEENPTENGHWGNPETDEDGNVTIRWIVDEEPENPEEPEEPGEEPEEPGENPEEPGEEPEEPGEEPGSPEEPEEAPRVTWLDENGEVVKEIPMPEGGDYSAEYPEGNPTENGHWGNPETDEDGNVTIRWTVDEEPTTPIVPDNPTNPADPADPVAPPQADDTPTAADPTPAVPVLPVAAAPATPAVVTPTVTPVAPTVPAQEPEEETQIPDEELPLADAAQESEERADAEEAEIEDLDEEAVPLAAGDSGRKWALVNFALMNLAVFESLMLLIGYFVNTKKSSEEEEEQKKLKKKGIMRLISLPVAVISVIAFCLTEDITLPTGFVDRWTLLMAVIAIVQTVVVAFSRKKGEEENKERAAL